MGYRLVAKAEDDLIAIWNYLAAESGSDEVVDRLIDSISRRFDFLSNNPLGGRARDEVLPGLRSFPVSQ